MIDRATSSPDEDDAKAEQKSIEESWQDLNLLKAPQKPPKKPSREDLSEPLPVTQPAQGQCPCFSQALGGVTVSP